MNGEHRGLVTGDELAFELVRRGPVYRAQQALGLIPARGLGIVRRVLILAVLTWVPLMVWAVVQRRLFAGTTPEPLLQHFGVHVRCLVAIPLFVAGEPVADLILRRIVPYFVSSGLVGDARPRFVEILRAMERWRDSMLAVLVLVGLTVVFVVGASGRGALPADEVSWAMTGGAVGGAERSHLGFGGWWFLLVVRPIFIFLLLLWAWRWMLATMLLGRLARLPLELVPTHPDRAAGLGFLEQLPVAFSPIVFAISAVIASRLAHDVLYHQQHVDGLRAPVVAFVVAVLALLLGPLVVFAAPLQRLKNTALLEYGALVGRHGRLVQRRWIRGEQVDDAGLLDAPEIGPVADAITLYDAVRRTKPAPLGVRSVLAVAVPTLVPMIALFAIEIPLKDMLLKLLKALG